MKIVRPTRPPSMAVVVDTIVGGMVELAIAPAHPTKDRIDVVYASEGVVGVVTGTNSHDPALAITPVMPADRRPLVRVYVLRSTSYVSEHSIEEF